MANSVDPNVPSEASAQDGHKVLISVGILVMSIVIFTEASGVNHDWGVIVGLLLFGVLLINIMNMSKGQVATTESYPWIPE
jgi:hypothetical protein